MADEHLLPVFALPVDWSDAPIERYAFRTDVLTSQNESEQLRGTRATPRRQVEFSWMAQGTQRQALALRQYNVGTGLWQAPLWMRATRLGASAIAGAVTLVADVAHRQFVAGGWAVLVGDDPAVAEVVQISAVGSGTLTVAAIAGNWPAGTQLVPSRVAMVEDGFGASAFRGDVAYGRSRLLLMQANPGTATAPLVTYRGLPVLDFAQVTPRDPESSLERDVDVMDGDIGLPLFLDITGQARPTQTTDFTLNGLEEIDRFIAMLYWLDGQRRRLWLPTYLDDLTATAIDGTTLTVDACGYTDNGDMRLHRRDVRVLLWDGTQHFRRITDSSALGATEALTLDDDLPGVDVEDIAQISFLQCVRSDTDIFELSWWSGDVVDAAIRWRGTHDDV